MIHCLIGLCDCILKFVGNAGPHILFFSPIRLASDVSEEDLLKQEEKASFEDCSEKEAGGH